MPAQVGRPDILDGLARSQGEAKLPGYHIEWFIIQVHAHLLIYIAVVRRHC